MRKDVEKHKREAREKHLDLALDTVSSREEQHKTLSEGEALVFKLQGYASKKDNNETFYSAQFYSHCGGYKMCIEIHVMENGKGFSYLERSLRQWSKMALLWVSHLRTIKPIGR